MLPAEEGMSLSIAVSGAHPASYNMDIDCFFLVKLSTNLHIDLVKNVMNLQLHKTTRINSVG
jgi:hypothetical protein